LLLAALAALAFAATARGFTPPKVTLKERVVIATSDIFLGDVAALEGSDPEELAELSKVSLGPAPGAGTLLILTRGQIEQAVQSAGLEGIPAVGPDRVEVRRAVHTLAESDLVPVLRDHIASVTCWQAAEIEVRSIRRIKGIELPAGDLSFRVSRSTAPSSYRNLMLPIEISVDGEPVRTLWIAADVRIRARILQAARRLPYGALVGAGDLRETLAEIRDPRVAYIRRIEEAEDKVTRRVLMPGDPVTSDVLAGPLAVRNGDIVRVSLDRAGIHLVARARAEQDGRLGQLIRVRNLDFDRVLKGRISGQGEVTIQ